MAAVDGVDLDTVIHLAWRHPPVVGVSPLVSRVQQHWVAAPAEHG